MAASNTRFTQSSLVNQKIPLTVITVSTATPSRGHHPARRCGGVAGYGARTAISAPCGWLSQHRVARS
jgi:hypothetical protein